MIRSLFHRNLVQLILSEELSVPRTWQTAVQLSETKIAPHQFTSLCNFSTTRSLNTNDDTSDNTSKPTATSSSQTPQSTNNESSTQSQSSSSSSSSTDILKNTKLWRQWVEGRLEDTTSDTSSPNHNTPIKPGSLPSSYGSPASTPNLRPRDHHHHNQKPDWKRTAKFERSAQDRIANILSSDTSTDGNRDRSSGRYGVLGTAYDAPRYVPGAAARAEEVSPRRISPHRLFYPGATYSPQDLNPYKAKEIVMKSDLMVNRGSISSKQVQALADFRNAPFLSNFITETGRLFPRRKTRLPAKLQRDLARQIKLARSLGIMNPTAKVVMANTRQGGSGGSGGSGGGNNRQGGSGENFRRRQQQQQQRQQTQQG